MGTSACRRVDCLDHSTGILVAAIFLKRRGSVSSQQLSRASQHGTLGSIFSRISLLREPGTWNHCRAYKMAARSFTVACIPFCYHCNNVTTEVLDVTVETLAKGQEIEAHGTAIMNGASTASLVNREDVAPPIVSNADGFRGTRKSPRRLFGLVLLRIPRIMSLGITGRRCRNERRGRHCYSFKKDTATLRSRTDPRP